MSETTNDPHAIEAPLLSRLEALSIPVEVHRHPPLHTVAESRELRGSLPGAHIKNLFLRDKKRNLWLVTVPESADIDLKALRHELDASGNLSFGSPDLLWEALGVRPGAVTPFAVMNDTGGVVTMVLATAVLENDPINAHPLHNEATAAIAGADLLRFLEDCGHAPRMLDLG